MTLRKGQKLIAWAIQKVGTDDDISISVYSNKGNHEGINSRDVYATRLIFNMSNEEFDKVMEEFK
jgi:hypothetical protein